MNIRKEFERIISKKKLSNEDIKIGKKIIDVCNDIYYNTDEESPLSDYDEYDKLFNKLKMYVPNLTSLTKSTTKRLVDVDHSYAELVGTLFKSNAVYEKDKTDKEQNSVEEFFNEKIKDNKKFKIVVTKKFDGNSVCLLGNKTKIIKGLTRGKDGKGADVSNMFNHLKYKSLKFKDFGVKTEVMITDEDFKKLCEDNNLDYKKPRSVVAGLLSRTDGFKYKDYLTAVPLRIQTKDKNLTREEEIELLKHILPKNIKHDFIVLEGTKKTLLKEIEKIYNKNIKERHNLNFAIDGLVIEILNEDLRNKLGRLHDKNNFEIALKFPPLEAIVEVKDIEFYLSENATGRITPVVIFEKVVFDGADCDHVSISNYKRFKELKLAKGDKVKIEYRNDVLSYLTKIVYKSDNPRIKFESTCPSCKEKLKVNKNKTFVHCTNSKCPAKKIGYLQNYIEKVDIKGIKKATLTKLVEANILNTIPDLYKISSSDILTVKGFKEKSAVNFVESVNNKRVIYDFELLGSLQIESFSLGKSKELCKIYSLNEILNFINESKTETIEKIQSIEGFGDIMAKYIVKGIIQHKEIIEQMHEIIEIKNIKDEIQKNKSTSGESLIIVFTGFRDKELKEKLELQGHKVTSNVSGKTNILVTKEKNSNSSSEKKAIELQNNGSTIQIMSVEEFKNKFN